MRRTTARNRTTRAVGLAAALGLSIAGVAGVAIADNVSQPPIRDVKGLNTGLTDPATGDEAPNRLIKAAKPGGPTGLVVAGPKSAGRRPVSWHSPASDGGADITGHRIVVKKGHHTLLTRSVGASTLELVLKRSQLADGVNKVFVSARNSRGSGSAASTALLVRK